MSILTAPITADTKMDVWIDDVYSETLTIAEFCEANEELTTESVIGQFELCGLAVFGGGASPNVRCFHHQM